MNWEDERYCRLYTRDTTDWLLGPWEARAVLGLVLRKLDRSGCVDLGADGLEGLAVMVATPLEIVEIGMAWWLKRRTFEMSGTILRMRNFVAAQESRASDRLRAADRRERQRTIGRHDDRENCSPPSQNVTGESRSVTESHLASPGVTSRHQPSLRAVLCCAVPSQDQDPPYPPPGGDVVGSSKPASAKRLRAAKSLMRPDWEPNGSTVAKLRTAGIDATALVPEFRDYWLGRGDGMSDWDATFRNRARELDRQGRAPRTPPSNASLPALGDGVDPDEAKANAAQFGRVVSDLLRANGGPDAG